MDELVKGMFAELEHGSHNQNTNVTDDDPIQTFKIALAHLDELPDYYTRLEKLEDEGEAYWENNDCKQWIKKNRANNTDILKDLDIAL